MAVLNIILSFAVSNFYMPAERIPLPGSPFGVFSPSGRAQNDEKKPRRRPKKAFCGAKSADFVQDNAVLPVGHAYILYGARI